MYLHSDVNAFYVSCQTAMEPALVGRPVIVATNNDGAIAALNAEAKALGLKRGQPLFEIQSLLRKHAVKVFSSNFILYSDFSARFYTTIGQRVPFCSAYSCDELFASLTGMEGLINYEDFGRDLRNTVYRHTSLKCGIGIASTKTLCKAATWAAKKYPKTQGVVVLDDPDRRDRLLALIEVREVWGIGSKLAKRLNEMGIRTAYELSQMDTRLVRRLMGVVVERTVRELRGEPCFALDDNPPSRKQIIVSRSFGNRTTELEDMRQAICAFSCRAAEKLRRDRTYASAITVFIQNSRHSNTEPYFSAVALEPLHATQDSREIIQAARTALQRIWKQGIRYAKAGVMLSEISDGREQLDLFSSNQPRRNSRELMQVIDRLNQSQHGTIFMAGEGIHGKYKGKQQWLSPCYTTRWADLPVAWLK
jgi:DNA polymerase V